MSTYVAIVPIPVALIVTEFKSVSVIIEAMEMPKSKVKLFVKPMAVPIISVE